MKKLVAVVAVTAALATPALAQTYYPSQDGYMMSQRGYNDGYTSVYIQGGSPGALYTQRGVMTDPDPFIRGSIQRNYNYYQNLNGG